MKAVTKLMLALAVSIIAAAVFVSLSVRAAPQPQGSSGCTNGYVRWVHTVADVTELDITSAAYQMTGNVDDHTAESSSSTVADCFTTTEVRGHTAQYTCANAYYKVRALVNSKTDNATDIYMGFGVDTDAVINATNRIAATVVSQTATTANDYMQYLLEYDVELVKDSYYGILVQAFTAGFTDHTNATAGWWEFQEQRCERGTP